MKALSFLEWFKQYPFHRYWNGDKIILHLEKVANFYNQPFSVDMLVNPIEYLPLAEDKHVNMAWQLHESLRLFEGWSKEPSGYYKEISKYYNGDYFIGFDIIFSEDNMKTIILRGNSSPESKGNPETLNDFITLCNLAGIKLRFNESNEKVKEMFK